jgi:glycine dehydrogenase subunit 2
VACKKILEQFLPTPVLTTRSDGKLGFEYNRPKSIGRVRAFYGNFGMFVRALAYIMANGPDGLRQTTEDAVLNANYIRKKLEGTYELPYKTGSMHEVVFSDRLQTQNGVKTGDIAKRLIDYGFHPYTTSFPLIVPGALMIEPTESESKEELDLFIDAMKSIAREVKEDPQLVVSAPHETRAETGERSSSQTGTGGDALDILSIIRTRPEWRSRAFCSERETGVEGPFILYFVLPSKRPNTGANLVVGRGEIIDVSL